MLHSAAHLAEISPQHPAQPGPTVHHLSAFTILEVQRREDAEVTVVIYSLEHWFPNCGSVTQFLGRRETDKENVLNSMENEVATQANVPVSRRPCLGSYQRSGEGEHKATIVVLI